MERWIAALQRSLDDPNPNAPAPVVTTFLSEWAGSWVLERLGLAESAISIVVISIVSAVVLLVLYTTFWNTTLIAAPAVAVDIIVALGPFRWPIEALLGFQR